jgi:hypothetical protein
VLDLIGAGELGPRLLEWKNRLKQTTGAQLVARLETAAEGKPYTDPVPFHLYFDAMSPAAGVGG